MANNDALYDAAVAGAGGAAQCGWLVATNAGTYVDFVVDVDILAVAIDLQIAPIAAGPSISQINLLQSITEAVLSARFPIANIPATYVDLGKAIAALFNALSPMLTNNPAIIKNILAGSNITVSIVNRIATVSLIVPTWHTIFDMNLAALPTSWSNANGPYAMGGYNWTKYGTAKQSGGGATNMFGIENGVGFRMQPNSAGTPATQDITVRPYITLSLLSALPTFTRFTPVRFSSIPIVGGDAINDVSLFAGFAIQQDAAPYRVVWSQQQLMRQNPAIAATFSSYSYGSISGMSTCVNAETSAEYLTRRVMRTTLPKGFAGMYCIHELASGVAWPVAESSWLWSGTAEPEPVATGPYAIPLAGLDANMIIEIGAGNNGHNLPGPWFSKLKLEAMY
jgi:hypothetical protein